MIITLKKHEEYRFMMKVYHFIIGFIFQHQINRPCRKFVKCKSHFSFVNCVSHLTNALEYSETLCQKSKETPIGKSTCHIIICSLKYVLPDYKGTKIQSAKFFLFAILRRQLKWKRLISAHKYEFKWKCQNKLYLLHHRG